MDARARARQANKLKRRDELHNVLRWKGSEIVEPIEHRKKHAPVDDLNGSVVSEPQAGADIKRGKRKNAHRRIQDTLDALWNNGTIRKHAGEEAEAWFAAGRRFQDDFSRAGFVGMAATNWEKVARTSSDSGLPQGIESAGHVYMCICRLGGFTSTGARIVWAVLGEGFTLKEYCDKNGMASQHEAKGHFVTSLGVIAGYYEGIT